jgi:two-component system, chemotaxis family, response regulator Rcp1
LRTTSAYWEHSTIKRTLEILLVEDHAATATLTIEALRDAKTHIHVHVMGDGEAALDFLQRRAPYWQAPIPDLIILDLTIPKMPGQELLRRIKADPRVRSIPVIVLTGTDDVDSIEDAYQNQVACYVVKPVEPDRYFNAIRALKEHWFHVVTLPERQKRETASTA